MEEKFRCNACGVEFESKEDFEKHLKEHHGGGHHEHH